MLYETAETGGIPDNTQANRHLTHAGVQIVENKNSLTRVRQILAKLLVATGLRLIGGKLSFVETDLNDAYIAFKNYATAGER